MSVLVALLVIGGVAVVWARGSDRRAAVFQPAPSAAAGGDQAGGASAPAQQPVVRVVSGPLNGLQKATFELATGTSSLTVRTAAIGDDLYRISASAETRQVPRVTVKDGVVRLTLARVGKLGKGEVSVTVNAAVRWSLRVSASVTTGLFDMSNGELTAARFAGDAAGIELRTPRPDGTLPVRITGGINQFRVETPGASAARVRIRGGTGRVRLGDRTINGVGPGRTFTAGGFASADDRVDVDAAVGIGSVTVASS